MKNKQNQSWKKNDTQKNIFVTYIGETEINKNPKQD